MNELEYLYSTLLQNAKVEITSPCEALQIVLLAEGKDAPNHWGSLELCLGNQGGRESTPHMLQD